MAYHGPTEKRSMNGDPIPRADSVKISKYTKSQCDADINAHWMGTINSGYCMEGAKHQQSQATESPIIKSPTPRKKEPRRSNKNRQLFWENFSSTGEFNTSPLPQKPYTERAMGDPPPKKDKLSLGSCCDVFCEDCILEISCHVESNCPDDCGGLGGNPIKNTCDGSGCIVNGVQDCPGCGCIPPWTEAKKRNCWSCGPYQLKKDYWEEAQWHCNSSNCPDCGSSSPCCELANYDWEQTFCNGGVSCEEQKRLQKLAMKCWWRKYTRNGPCQCGSCTEGRTNCECQGTTHVPGCCSDPNCIASNGSMTCAELLRMHNGGQCSWDDDWTLDYIMKGCTWACANKPSCASCLDCNCDPPPTVEKEKKEILDVPDRSMGVPPIAPPTTYSGPKLGSIQYRPPDPGPPPPPSTYMGY